MADVFYLKDGGKIEGSGVDDGDSILIRVKLGSIRVAKADIDRVVKKQSIIDLYNDRKRKAPRTADGLFALGQWCASAGLRKQALSHYRDVISIDGDHAAARKELGYRRAGQRWLTDDEFHRWQGEIRFRGRWMPPETVAAILQAEATQASLVARRNKPKPVVAGALSGQPGAKPTGQPAGNGGNNGRGAGGARPGLELTGSIRPSKRFIDKYFITSPFSYGTAGARTYHGGVYSGNGVVGNVHHGPVYYGPYPYDGWRQYGPAATGIQIYSGQRLASYYGSSGSRYGRGFGHGYGGGLALGYSFGNDRFRLHGGLNARSGFGGSHIGHSLFGRYRSSNGRFGFTFRFR